MAQGSKHKVKPTRGTLTSFQKGLFVVGTQITDASGRLNAPFREMTIGQDIHPGRHSTKHINPNKRIWFSDKRQMELPADYKGTGGKKRGGGKITRDSWRAVQIGSDIIQIDKRQFYRHLIMVAHQLPIATEHWKLVLAHRALAVFQESFKLKRFNSNGTSRWKVNTEWTRKKEAKIKLAAHASAKKPWKKPGNFFVPFP